MACDRIFIIHGAGGNRHVIALKIGPLWGFPKGAWGPLQISLREGGRPRALKFSFTGHLRPGVAHGMLVLSGANLRPGWKSSETGLGVRMHKRAPGTLPEAARNRGDPSYRAWTARQPPRRNDRTASMARMPTATMPILRSSLPR